MKDYLLSLFFHLLFVLFLFFLAVSPRKALSPGMIDQVFLVAEAPMAFVPVGPKFIESVERVNPIPAIKPENTLEPVPIKPEKSLSEKLTTRLTGATSENWNPTTATRSKEPREKIATAAETIKEVSPNQTPDLPEQASISTGDGTAQVESESGFSDGWYLALLSRRLTERWNPAREGIAVVKREVTVSFTITRDGRIRDVTLARASGNPRFDRSGSNAVIESDFLPPLPASWGRKELQVSVRFREK